MDVTRKSGIGQSYARLSSPLLLATAPVDGRVPIFPADEKNVSSAEPPDVFFTMLASAVVTNLGKVGPPCVRRPMTFDL